MSDEMQGSDMPEESGGGMQPEPAAAPASPMAALGDFSTGEGMVALAGMILLAIWLIFEVITDDFSLGTLTILLAAAAVILPRVDRAKVESYHPLGSLMKVIGYALAGIGVIEIIYHLETSFFSGVGGMTVLAAILGYVAYVAAFMGARRIGS